MHASLEQLTVLFGCKKSPGTYLFGSVGRYPIWIITRLKTPTFHETTSKSNMKDKIIKKGEKIRFLECLYRNFLTASLAFDKWRGLAEPGVPLHSELCNKGTNSLGSRDTFGFRVFQSNIFDVRSTPRFSIFHFINKLTQIQVPSKSVKNSQIWSSLL